MVSPSNMQVGWGVMSFRLSLMVLRRWLATSQPPSRQLVVDAYS
jgi:hypothetical protein